MNQVSLYETSTFYYLVGYDAQEISFRLLKVNRQIERPKELADILREDRMVYSREDIVDVLEMISEGNRTSGGMTKVCTAYGIVGFVKFLDCFYFTLITQRREVGCIAGNIIYSIRATETFPVKRRDAPESNAFKSFWKKLNKKLNQTSAEIAESRYMDLYHFVDMTKDFFFSYTYDLTNSLQKNFATCKASNARWRYSSSSGNGTESSPTTATAAAATAAAAEGEDEELRFLSDPQEIFRWNNFQLEGTRTI